LRPKTVGVETIRVSDELNVDITPDGSVYGIELLNANEQLRATDGGQFVLVPTPMDRIPIYARGGAVIPMWPEAPPSTDYHPTAVELHLFVPEGDGVHRTFVQEDDGLTTAAQDGAMYRTTFELNRDGSSLTLRADVSGRGFPEFARREFRLFVRGATPDVTLDGRRTTATEDYVVIPNAGTGFTAGIELVSR